MFVFILVVHLLVCSSSFAGTRCDLSKITHADTERIRHALPASFYLTKLDIHADIPIEDAELRALCALPEGMILQREMVEHALVRLAKKQKFKTIYLETAPDLHGLRISATLESEWTVAHVHMQGTLLGKDKYRRFYAMEPGEAFDLTKHELSKDALLQALAAEGYCNAALLEAVSYDETTKTVGVALTIDHKKRFTIDDIQVRLCIAEDVCIQDASLLEKKIKKLLRNLLKSSSYAKEVLDHGAKKLHEYLLSLGFFNSSIELEEAFDRRASSVQLSFVITLKNKNLYEFHGNTFFTTEVLLEQVCLFGKSASLIPPSLLAEEFRALYKKEGFWHVDITWEDDGERIFFFIREGKRIRISGIVIHGASEISAAELIRKHGRPLLHARYFHGDLLKQLLEEIGQEYLQQGFWDFTILTHDYLPLTETTYQLVLRVQEGKRRFLTGVTLEQDFSCAHDTCAHDTCITKYQNLQTPISFDIRIMKEQRHVLTKALQAQGRLYARPYPELVEEEQGTRLVWKYAGSTDVVTFGDTIILGNSSLPAHIIMRELLYKKGDVWDQRKIEKSVARLKRLGIFDTVTLAPEDLATTELSKTLLLKYIEDFPYEVRARVGIQGVNRNIVQFNKGLSYKAGGSFLVKNPFNKGDCFRFDLDFSRYMHTIAARYKFPWLLHQPIRTEIKAYSSHYDQPFVIGSPQVLYRALQDGFLCGFSKDYAPFDADINIGCEWLEIKPGDGCGGRAESLARAIFLNPRLIGKRYPYIFLQPSIFYSSLDNKIQPTRGVLSLISCKAMIAPTFSRAAFFKILLEQSFFVPWGPLVFAWRGRCGTICNTDFQNINPIERFYLGGAYSVRSYEPDLAPPLNPFRDASGCLHLVPTGGRSMANMNSELRFPLYGSLSGVVFNDLGVLSDKSIRAAVKEHKVVGAVGFGLRVNTVVGPIRFDMGWKLHRNQVPAGVRPERPYAWFLALGNAF